MRAAAYLRVSSESQVEGFSLAAQRDAIAAYCAAQGWPPPAVYEDAGRSAHEDAAEKRPAWRALMADAASGRLDVVVVHKLDRWSRNVPLALTSLATLEKRGVGFVSLGEQMSFVGPFGRAMLAILAVFAQLYSDNLSREVRKGLDERKRQGYVSHNRPFGALIVDDGRALAVDPARAADLTRLLELVAERSYLEAALALNAEGIAPRRGARWYGASVRLLVRRAGWLAEQPDPWPARLAAARARHDRPPVRRDRAVRMLTGLMRCGHCGGRVHYGPPHRNGTRGLQCSRQPEGPNRCLPGAPRRRPVEHYEAQVAAWVAALPDEAYLMEAAARLAPPGDPAHDQIVAIRAERVRLREAYRANLYTTAEMQQQAAALDERERAIAPATPGAARYAAELATLRDAFTTLPPVAQNAALAALVEAVTITGPDCAIAPHPQLARLLAATRSE